MPLVLGQTFSEESTGLDCLLPSCRPSCADATILRSMSPSETSSGGFRPRVGIPWRTLEEQQAGERAKLDYYFRAVESAGAQAEGVALDLPRERLEKQLAELDAFVLPGSPADVEPSQYGAVNRGLSAPPDAAREQTDSAILKHAFAEKKPVLAICYGCQLLNVYLGGTLIQDLRAETGTKIPHRKKDIVPEPADDPRHAVGYERSSHLAEIGGERGEINSSHHQAVAQPGKNLRVTAHAGDGTIEGVEWTGDSNWVVGVQWHPERMVGDAAAERLFRDFVAAARQGRASAAEKR